MSGLKFQLSLAHYSKYEPDCGVFAVRCRLNRSEGVDAGTASFEAPLWLIQADRHTFTTHEPLEHQGRLLQSVPWGRAFVLS